jgi:dihydrofolate synthase/folylpolyglutamate synthase
MDAYEETLAWLSALEVSAGWDLKLERMRAILAHRGHPEAAWPAIHVAGTNGKGSTAAMVEAVLRAAGRRTGLYTSPHLVDFSERIRVQGRTIPPQTVVDLVRELRRDLERTAIALTHFEFATLIAFEWFARVGVEVGVIEVGLGGRLDATNTVRPLATAITTIARDHEAWLGHDLRSIAAEKAGIAKPGVPLVIGALPPEAEAVVRERAAVVGAPVVRAGRLEGPADALAYRDGAVAWDGLRLGLPGAFQRQNAAVALGVLACLGERLPCTASAVRAGLASVEWPGRLATLGEGPRVLLDGAHNPAGAAGLAAELPAWLGGRRLVIVFAVMEDKDWPAMIEPLLPFASRVVLTRVGRRGLAPGRIADALGARVPTQPIVEPRGAIRAACDAAGPDGAVLVTGSLFLVGEAYAALGGANRAAPLFEPWNAADAGGTGASP